MSKTVVCTLEQFPGILRRDIQKFVDGLTQAAVATASRAVPVVRERVPVAFGELKSSVTALTGDGNAVAFTAVEAPHAGAVEEGSLPHTPNFEKLLAWVKLRGLQGLTKRGNIRTRFPKALGPTTQRQAMRVALMLKEMSKGNPGGKDGKGKRTSIDAAEQVARAIAKGIELHGTPPHWYVRESLPEIMEILDQEIRKRAK